jgi:hypothetical protein
MFLQHFSGNILPLVLTSVLLLKAVSPKTAQADLLKVLSHILLCIRTFSSAPLFY